MTFKLSKRWTDYLRGFRLGYEFTHVPSLKWPLTHPDPSREGFCLVAFLGERFFADVGLVCTGLARGDGDDP